MKLSKKLLLSSLLVAATFCSLHAIAADDTPANVQADRSAAEIASEMASDQKTVNDLLGPENSTLKTQTARDAAAPKLLPLVHRMSSDLNDLAAAVPQFKEQIAGSQLQMVSLLSVLGDKTASDQIKEMAASKDPTHALAGQAHQMMARFYVTENTPAAQSALVDDLQKLDRANPASILLTQLTIEIGHEEGSSELRQRLLKTAAEEMNNPVAVHLKSQLEAEKAAADEDALLANKPLTFAGKLPDGKDFSTESLKGKVILIDFWATWCGPCKAELPRLKQLYNKYHEKGPEVVGISNDYDIEALRSFIQAANMPWPQLFDPDAAAKQKWNSLTTGQNITGIPVMYLIDRKGILRSVNARENTEEMIAKLLAE